MGPVGVWARRATRVNDMPVETRARLASIRAKERSWIGAGRRELLRAYTREAETRAEILGQRGGFAFKTEEQALATLEELEEQARRKGVAHKSDKATRPHAAEQERIGRKIEARHEIIGGELEAAGIDDEMTPRWLDYDGTDLAVDAWKEQVTPRQQPAEVTRAVEQPEPEPKLQEEVEALDAATRDLPPETRVIDPETGEETTWAGLRERTEADDSWAAQVQVCATRAGA